MSTNANPGNARVWTDGDAYIFPVGTDVKNLDVFGTLPAAFKAFGGIEVGFEQTADEPTTDHKVWNYRDGAYRVTRDIRTDNIKFKAVDDSEAAFIAKTDGGSLKKIGTTGTFETVRGNTKTHGILVLFVDGDKKQALLYERAELASPPVHANIKGDGLDGIEFDWKAVGAVREFTNAAPAGMTAPA